MLELGNLYVVVYLSSFLLYFVTDTWNIAFFGIVDLLAILPYYIEVALQEDTVRTRSYLLDT